MGGFTIGFHVKQPKKGEHSTNALVWVCGCVRVFGGGAFGGHHLHGHFCPPTMFGGVPD